MDDLKMQTQTPRIRPTVELQVLAETIKAMSHEEAEKALQPEAELGIEMRRAVTSAFIGNRRLARENAKMREENSAQRREVRRNIAELENSEYAFLNSVNLLKCRRTLRKIDDIASRLREVAGNIGGIIEKEMSYLPLLLGRDTMFDLLNVGRYGKELLEGRERTISIYDLVRYGFADEVARGKLNRDIEPMQFCLLRAGRAPFVPPKVEASPERFSEKAAELDAFCDEIDSLALTMKANAKDMDDCEGRPAAEIRSTLDAYVTLLERAFALWERVQPALMDCKEFSIEQKAALLKVDPAKLADKDFPDGTTLLEMVTAQMEGDFMPDHEVGRFLWLGVGAHSSEPREHVEFYRGATSQEAMIEEAHKRGASVFNAVETLQ
jgi:hypothetical protein